MTILVLAVLCFACLSAIVSGFETALFSLREHHLAELSGSNRRLRAGLRYLLRTPLYGESGILLLVVVTNLPLILLGIYLVNHWTQSVAAFPEAGALLVVLVLVLILDLVPKLIALANPRIPLRLFLIPFLQLRPIIMPTSLVLSRGVSTLQGWIVPDHYQKREEFTEDEFESLVEIHAEEGAIAPGESRVIAEIIRLGDKTTRDCMTPRVDAFTLSIDLTQEEMMRQLKSGGWWKVPVYRDTPDTIVGILLAQKALQHPEAPFQEYVESPVFVTETMLALNAFRDYLSEPHSMTIVLDEFGGTEGVLTHEDIVQEVVSDGSATQDETEIRYLTYNRILVTGHTRIDEVNDALGVELPEEDGLDTIGGLVFNRLGHLPKVGEATSIGDVELTVRRMGARRVEEVILQRH